MNCFQNCFASPRVIRFAHSFSASCVATFSLFAASEFLTTPAFAQDKNACSLHIAGGDKTNSYVNPGKSESDPERGKDLKELKVKQSCKTVKLKMEHIGKMPAMAMGHNWVLLKKGQDPKAVADGWSKATSTSPEKKYTKEKDDRVIAYTPFVGTGLQQFQEISFKVDKLEKGEYTFICTFPAHFMTGMKGTLTIE